MFQEKYLMPPVAIELTYIFGIQFFSLFIWYLFLLFVPSVLVIENVRNLNNAIVILITVLRIIMESPYSNPLLKVA